MSNIIRDRLSFLRFPSRFDRGSKAALREYLTTIEETQGRLQLQGLCKTTNDVNDLESDYVLKYTNYALMGLVYYNLKELHEADRCFHLCLKGFHRYKSQRSCVLLYILLCNCYLACCSKRLQLVNKAGSYLKEFDEIINSGDDDIFKPDLFFAGLLEAFGDKTMNQARNEVINRAMFMLYDYLANVYADEEEKLARFAIKRSKYEFKVDKIINYENICKHCLLLADRFLRKRQFRVARRFIACAKFHSSTRSEKMNVLRQYCEYASVLLNSSMEYIIKGSSFGSADEEKSEYYEYLLFEKYTHLEIYEKEIITDKLLATYEDALEVSRKAQGWYLEVGRHYETEGQFKTLDYVHRKLMEIHQVMAYFEDYYGKRRMFETGIPAGPFSHLGDKLPGFDRTLGDSYFFLGLAQIQDDVVGVVQTVGTMKDGLEHYEKFLAKFDLTQKIPSEDVGDVLDTLQTIIRGIYLLHERKDAHNTYFLNLGLTYAEQLSQYLDKFPEDGALQEYSKGLQSMKTYFENKHQVIGWVDGSDDFNSDVDTD